MRRSFRLSLSSVPPDLDSARNSHYSSPQSREALQNTPTKETIMAIVLKTTYSTGLTQACLSDHRFSLSLRTKVADLTQVQTECARLICRAASQHGERAPEPWVPAAESKRPRRAASHHPISSRGPEPLNLGLQPQATEIATALHCQVQPGLELH